MLEFKQNDTAAAMVLTLSEFVTLPEPNYLFVFTHGTTKDVVAFVKKEIDDQSRYSDRYNKFTINASTIFAGKQPGEWHYKVFEQISGTNTDPSLAGSLLESGKLLLDRSADFSFKQYDSATSFKTYNG